MERAVLAGRRTGEPSAGTRRRLDDRTGSNRNDGQDDQEADIEGENEPDKNREPALVRTNAEDQASRSRFGQCWQYDEDE